MTETEIEKKWENTVWDTDIYLDDLDGEEQMTNEDWLRTLPADERVKEVLSRGFMTEKRTAEEFVEWLKEKHDEMS